MIVENFVKNTEMIVLKVHENYFQVNLDFYNEEV